jgi:acyl-CoA synthetase (AMP-forming)/AMP-acid ligase II
MANLLNEIIGLADLPGSLRCSHGPKIALMVEDQQMTYAELDLRSNRVANALIGMGVAPGERIAVVARDSIDSVVLLFGTAKAKGVLVNINWRLAADEIAYILHDANPRLFIVDEDFQHLLPRISARAISLPQIATIASLNELCEKAADSVPQLSYDTEDVVVQIYTSGTTGHPKGVQLPNRSFFAIAREMEAAGDPWIGWSHATVSLLFVPTFHIGGLWWLVRGLALGSTNILLRTFDPKSILRVIPRYRVTKTCMVPSMIQVLLAEPGCSTTDFSSLETIVYGGSPISGSLLERGMEMFQCDFCQIYGMTETGNMAICLRPEDHMIGDGVRLQAAGKPLPGVAVKILDPQRRALGPGVVGEIAIQSPARMVGYWNLPEATRSTLVDDWVMTGDAGYRDEDGFIYVCDRVKDMIISAGENIYPAEIENVIRTHPGVADVAVIGVPDDFWGEAVKAVVVPKDANTMTAGEIMRHVRTRLAEFKMPKSIDFVPQLPRNVTGKVLKAKLREPYWKDRQRLVN